MPDHRRRRDVVDSSQRRRRRKASKRSGDLPPLLAMASYLWIAIGALILLDVTVYLAMGEDLEDVNEGVALLIALLGGAFIYIGAQSLNGETEAAVGNGAGSIIFAVLVFVGGTVNIREGQKFTGVLGIIFAIGLLAAGVMALMALNERTAQLWQRLLVKIRGEFIDIIEWTEPKHGDILAYRFPRYQNEIKNGAQLSVREGQVAAFVNEGQLADVFEPGLHRLETANLPILSTLKGWKHGFKSPFKAEVYFISTRQWMNQKWGTQEPIMLRDPEFGPIRARPFGTYAFRVSDAGTFLKQLVAADPLFETYEVAAQLRNTIVSRFIDAMGAARIPMLDLAGNYAQISTLAREKIGPDLAGMGVAVTQFYVENIMLPPEVEKALDNRSKMSVLGNLDQYAKYQTAEVIGAAAKNPGSLAGMVVGIGAAAVIGAHAGSVMAPAAAASGPPLPLPQSVGYFAGINGRQVGPFDIAALAVKVRENAILPTTLVWKHGMANWAPAASVPELQGLFAITPPPFPEA